MFKIVDFNVHGDYRGKLVALESFNTVPFAIKRVYYVFGSTSDVIRGRHAHYNLSQMLVCVSGSCDFTLDDGYERSVVHLDSPSKGLLLTGLVWREFTNFSKNCVVVVLASEYYDTSDYIYDYEEFLKIARSK
ncbi:sugar 3,4-ketoisomerase [Succinimonas amylolytica]|uniref:sugar 3,4-ketoisomerase n=1 Tax=Succinimonas amylolytica TaxID=83769 RepID=UPI001FE140AA|nr:FdtA/QdtA family cupin domain-containing protein [Succinimonas amylolytica]